jgi:hypothetical protein
MKKITFVLVLMFATSLVRVQAQMPTMHNPDAKVTVTKDQIKSWGEAAKQIVSSYPVLDFEGLGNLEEISQFYNGGISSSGFAGNNHGISFSGSAMAIIDADNGGTGNFANESSPNTVMLFLKGCGATINVSAGFTTGLSFYYTSSTAGTVNIYDGPDGTGNLLVSKAFLPIMEGNAEEDPTGYFDSWKSFAVAFSGNAKSVILSGVENQCGFDDITFGSKTPGQGVKAEAKSKSKSKSKSEEPDNAAQASTFTSPTVKGKYLVAGSNRLELNIGSENQKYGSSESKTSYFDFDFQPRVGYFVIDNLAAGLFMDLDIYSDKAKDDGMLSDKGTTFIIGPFARYYIPVSDKLVPFAEAQVGFGIDNYKYRYYSSDEWSKTNEGVFTFRLGGGATYFFNDIVGADLFLGFLHDSYKYKDNGTGGERASDSKYIYNEFIMQLGIVCILDF